MKVKPFKRKNLKRKPFVWQPEKSNPRAEQVKELPKQIGMVSKVKTNNWWD